MRLKNGFSSQNEDNKKVRQLFARNGLQLSAPLKLFNFNISVTPADGKNNKQFF